MTYTRPKHLLPIANRAHIEHVFDLLAFHRIRDVVLTTSYMAEAFDGVVRSARTAGIEVQVAHEPQPLGTAGAMKNAQELLGEEPFLAMNADVLTDADVGAVIEFHRDRGADATIMLTPVEDPSAYGVVPTEPDGRVLGFVEKPPRETATTNLINAGIYVMEPAVLERIPVGEEHSVERTLFPELVAEGARLFATRTDAYWMDIGTPEKLLSANLDALAGRFSCEMAGTRAGDALIGDGATVHEDARISSSCVGAGAIVGSAAVVERSVLLPGATVASGAVVRDSIIGQNARIGPDTKIAGETIADEDVVEGG